MNALAITGIILFLLYLTLIRGRTGHPGLKKIIKNCYAHRGLYGKGIPENSLAAFRLAIEKGYGMELDLHLLKDGNLAVLHDSSLLRMTGKQGVLEDLSAVDLPDYPLLGTAETIPEFSQVLALCRGRVPLIIELKSKGNNADRLTEAACRILEDYNGPFCLESFDPRCLLWLKTHRPDWIRGQLSENLLKAENSKTPWLLRFAGSFHLESFLTKPDFIAHRFRDRKTLSNFLIRKLWRIPGITWTVQTPEEYEQAVREGWAPIFEGFFPEQKQKA